MDAVLSLRMANVQTGSDALEIPSRPVPAAAPAPAAAKAAAAASEEPDFFTAMAELQQIRSQLAEAERQLGETKVIKLKSDRTIHFLRTLRRWKGLGPKIGADMELGCVGLVVRRKSTPEQYQAFKEGLASSKNRLQTMMKRRLGRELSPVEKERIRRMALIGGILSWYETEAHSIKRMAARQGSCVFRLRMEEGICWRKVGFFLAFSFSFSFFLSFFLSLDFFLSFFLSSFPPLSFSPPFSPHSFTIRLNQSNQTQEAKQRLAPATMLKPKPIPLRRPAQFSPLCQSFSALD